MEGGIVGLEKAESSRAADALLGQLPISTISPVRD